MVSQDKNKAARGNWVAILDAGSQYGGLIDRNVRELGVRTALLPLDTPIAKLSAFDAIIISGGPSSVEEAGAPDCDPQLFDCGKPILGICYGMQLMARHCGGKVGQTSLREDGALPTTFIKDSALFSGLNGPQQVLMSHGDSVTALPPNFRISGGDTKLISAMENQKRRLYGTQFHPEVFQTEAGSEIFKNFLFGIADLADDYSLEDQMAEAIAVIHKTVLDRDVVLFLSGGVDSTVLAALMAQAIKDKSKIHAFHIDTGFMRANESQSVITALRAAGIAVELIAAADQFATARTTIDGQQTPPLNQVVDPQIKRKIIGDTFVKIRENILKKHALHEDTVLAQGSLRPDLIESGSHLASSQADVIKTHHNDTEAVRALRLQNRVVEPLQQFYKDQVRAMGRRLGLPESLIARHPFPGPGLAIRVLCADKPYRLGNHDGLQKSLDSFLLKEGYEDFKAHLLPVRTVGVQGDGRSYKYMVGIENLTRAQPNWEKLKRLASIIPNNNHSVNRVCYLFGQVDRLKLSVTPTHLTLDALEQVRAADAIVASVMLRDGLTENVSQLPVISFPVNFDVSGARSIALRPFKTPDFMTGIPAMPGTDIPQSSLDEIVKRIIAEVPGIVMVAYDLSSKPPGTTEWE